MKRPSPDQGNSVEHLRIDGTIRRNGVEAVCEG
jgi:hypothetical protein